MRRPLVFDTVFSTTYDGLWLTRIQRRPRRIILFGSRARGEAHEDSDVDLLIVLAEVKDRVAEMVRLTRVLRGLILPAELLVVSQAMFDDWSDLPGTVYYDARREGQTLYDAA